MRFSKNDTKRLSVSFSGGKTSAVMTKYIIDRRDQLDYDEICITFANTGCEHPATLQFVHDCESHWGWDVNWMEAKITLGKRIGPRPKTVDFESASQDGKPFRDYIEKHGIPNHNHRYGGK